MAFDQDETTIEWLPNGAARGFDLRTVRHWMDHSDIESTMRYLKPSRSEQTRAKVNEIFAGY